MNNRKPILVTGSHRSGTTWTGKMISASPSVAYIHEPLNIDIRIGTNSRPFKYWFQYICDENEGNYRLIFQNILKFKYPLGHNIFKARTGRDIAKITRDQLLFFNYCIRGKRPLIKDPFAFFSAEWLYKNFNMDVLVLIRHPAAFCSSLKIKNWKFNFSNLLDQTLLMRDLLYPYEKEIKDFLKNEQNIIDQATLLWNCIHFSILRYQEKYPNWLYIKHEHLSLDPFNQFRSIYEKLNLEYTSASHKKIEGSSGTHNPVEQVPRDEFKRNSKENVMNWKNRLSNDEIDRIKERTSTVASLFYTEREW